MNRDEEIHLSFDKFCRLVSRVVEGQCGLSADDLPDIDFSDFYPGEIATKGEYSDAAKDCADEVLSNAGWSKIEEIASL